MGNVDTKLARVRWSQGQILRPDHLVAQEASAQEELALRVTSLGIPAWGVVQLAWDEAALVNESQLLIRALEVVMPSGELLSLGRNTRLVGPPLTFADTTQTAVTVFLSLMPAEAPDTREGPLPVIAPTDVHRVYKQVILSTVPPERAVETLELLHLGKGTDGSWCLWPDFSPPTLDLARTPFFRAQMASLGDTLRGLEGRLKHELGMDFLAGDSIANVKSVLRSLFEVKAALADIGAGASVHPQALFTALRGLYFELYFFQGEAGELDAELAATPYVHDQLMPSLTALLQGIDEAASRSWGRTHILEFTLNTGEGLFELSERLPDDAAESTEVYFIVQRPRVDFHFDINWVKLASKGRLRAVHRLSLVGVGMKRVDLPPMARSLGPNVDYYRIQEGDEWRHAKADRSLSFYSLSGFQSLKLYLGWREN